MVRSYNYLIFPHSGYISPEYAFDGVCSIKSDVFSFGVLVLEIISGKRTAGFYPYDGKQYNLISYVSINYSNKVACSMACAIMLEYCQPDKNALTYRLGNFGELENGANWPVVV